MYSNCLIDRDPQVYTALNMKNMFLQKRTDASLCLLQKATVFQTPGSCSA